MKVVPTGNSGIYTVKWFFMLLNIFGVLMLLITVFAYFNVHHSLILLSNVQHQLSLGDKRSLIQLNSTKTAEEMTWCKNYKKQIYQLLGFFLNSSDTSELDTIQASKFKIVFDNEEKSSNLTHCFCEQSLKYFNKTVYDEMMTKFKDYKCQTPPDANSSKYLKNYVLYSQPEEHIAKSFTGLVLFTTMYHSSSKQSLFINVIFNWAHLENNYGLNSTNSYKKIQPVLFINDMSIVNKSGLLMHLAQKLGWVILLAPACIKTGFPLLNSMFHTAIHLFPNATWYGYANGDLLLTPMLWQNIEEINMHNAKTNSKNPKQFIPFISNRRREVELPHSEILYNFTRLIQLSNALTPKSGMAIDIFIYHTSCKHILQEMPPFAVGRRGYDNWLIYDILRRNLSAADLTLTNPMIHIALAGVSRKSSSHRSRKDSEFYNMRLPQVKAVALKVWYKYVQHLPLRAVFDSRTSKGIQKFKKKNRNENCLQNFFEKNTSQMKTGMHYGCKLLFLRKVLKSKKTTT